MWLRFIINIIDNILCYLVDHIAFTINTGIWLIGSIVLFILASDTLGCFLISIFSFIFVELITIGFYDVFDSIYCSIGDSILEAYEDAKNNNKE